MRQIEPIKWEPYTGETTIDRIVIRKGKKIIEDSYKPDKVKAVPRGNAYIIGNGPSRKGFDLTQLKSSGQPMAVTHSTEILCQIICFVLMQKCL